MDPLTCPKCSGEMEVISVIEDEGVIKKILNHLNLRDVKARLLPKATGPSKLLEQTFVYSTSHFPDFTRSDCGGSNKWL